MLKKFIRFFCACMVVPEWLIAKICIPECQIDYEDVKDALTKLKDFDLMCSRRCFELSNWLIPGFFKHIAVFHGGWVYEASTKGVRKIEIHEWMLKKDYVGICRLATPITAPEPALVFLKSKLGDAYDYDFIDMKAVDKEFCSRYAYQAASLASPEFKKSFKIKHVFGVSTITPSDFWNAALCSKLERVASYN